ncbi:hypothetical protein HPB48_000865 [Haemaphysalis longicornis]|uniref:Endonuclease/exonuclease/phosphatase domain-containing protein n=1 Tax=Haemaphysalis longicornis TaxID=44386 RepID=A0A9J6GA17_HAELO|nr:hypothetical protein HPB48_000865 [Haemaphysalis longicornis]
METFQDTMRVAKDRPTFLSGDFNAPHPLWGYKFCSKRGKEIANFIDQYNSVLLNDTQTPTPQGTSTAKDTTPDL